MICLLANSFKLPITLCDDFFLFLLKKKIKTLFQHLSFSPFKKIASAERSFSKLKLIKSYLRSTMSQERLNGLTILSIEKHILEQIDFNSLIIDFLSKNACRINLQ